MSTSTDDKIRVGVVGATGYTGSELLRLLLGHPGVALQVVTSRSEAGVPLAAAWPNLRGKSELAYQDPAVETLAGSCDLVFFATPHTVAQSMVAPLLEKGCKVIDLSADFRIRDVAVWEKWYGTKHLAPELLERAVYGLPETHRKAIRDAELIACPGCYPTAIQLGFLPLLENGLVELDSLVANAASGVSGAGRQAKVPNLLAELSDNFKAYAVDGHRHLPEIEQQLELASGSEVNLTFVPHLLPIIRGIHATLYARPKKTGVDCRQFSNSAIAKSPLWMYCPLAPGRRRAR